MSLADLGPLSELLLSAVLWAGLVAGLALLFLLVGLWWRDRS
jgi:hypothetical protein